MSEVSPALGKESGRVGAGRMRLVTKQEPYAIGNSNRVLNPLFGVGVGRLVGQYNVDCIFLNGTVKS